MCVPNLVEDGPQQPEPQHRDGDDGKYKQNDGDGPLLVDLFGKEFLECQQKSRNSIVQNTNVCACHQKICASILCLENIHGQSTKNT